MPLARGWERQLDEKANPIFYDGRPLTAARYHRWLRDNARALGRAARTRRSTTPRRPRRALLERGLPYLKLADARRGWRI